VEGRSHGTFPPANNSKGFRVGSSRIPSGLKHVCVDEFDVVRVLAPVVVPGPEFSRNRTVKHACLSEALVALDINVREIDGFPRSLEKKRSANAGISTKDRMRQIRTSEIFIGFNNVCHSVGSQFRDELR
jgi:hypothetical protein